MYCWGQILSFITLEQEWNIIVRNALAESGMRVLTTHMREIVVRNALIEADYF